MKQSNLIGKKILITIILVILCLFIFPVLWLFLTSIKDFKDAFSVPPKLIFTPTIRNFKSIFVDKNIHHYFFNSLFISSSATFVALLVGVPGGYSLAQFEFRAKEKLGFFILSIRIAPPIMSLFPLYMIFFKIGLLGTKLSIIIMYVVFNLPLAVWVMQIFFRDVPKELREAAIIDGCSEIKAFWEVMLPLARSGLAATSILCLIQSWNEYLFALVLSSRTSATLPIAITSYRTYQGVEWGPISAAGIIVMLPMVLFGLFIQRNLVQGMTMGAVKG